MVVQVELKGRIWGLTLGPGACPLQKWGRLCVVCACVHGQCPISELRLGSCWAGPLSALRAQEVCRSRLRCGLEAAVFIQASPRCFGIVPPVSLPSWPRAAHLAPLWVPWSVQLWSLQHSWPAPVCGVCSEQSSPAGAWRGDTGSESSGVMEGLPRPR